MKQLHVNELEVLQRLKCQVDAVQKLALKGYCFILPMTVSNMLCNPLPTPVFIIGDFEIRDLKMQ